MKSNGNEIGEKENSSLKTNGENVECNNDGSLMQVGVITWDENIINSSLIEYLPIDEVLQLFPGLCN